MKITTTKLFSTATLLLFLLITSVSYAQPGGGPGGRPMGPPPGGSNGRPSMSDRERMRRQYQQQQAAEKAQQVRQKRTVKEGDLFKVVGTLQDSVSGEGIPYVNVAILSAEDTQMVKGGITDLNGYFEIANVPQGKMLLRVSAIGYKNIMTPFTVENNTALGTIKVAPGATTLSEVKVTASRPLYAMDGEKLIYNVADDPTIQTGTTSDALQNAPGVEVDIEGNITLRGVSSVEIWVNDKPSKLTEENLKTYLETLPANALDRIETITNPSAKYATSADAVINIITSAYIKSNHFISFGVNGATQPFVSPWVSYTWANEKLSVNLYASGRYNYSNNSGWSKTTYRKDSETADKQYDTTAIDTSYNQSNSKRLNGNIFARVSYAIDTMTDIEFMGHYNYSHNTGASTMGWERTSFMPFEQFKYTDTKNNSGNSGFGMAGIDFTHKFDKKGHNIRASIHENFNNGNSQNDFVRLYESGSTYTLGQNYDKCYLDKYITNNFSADVRYNRPYCESGELSFGLGYGFKGTSRSYNVIDSISTSNVRDELRSYDFDDSEHNVEADVEWTRRFGNFTLELGFGTQYEHIDFKYFGSEKYPFTIDDTACNFITFSPSIHMSYRTEDMHNFKLNYSLRMRHPGEENITTYQRYSVDSYSIGNRDLVGTYSYTHNAEVGWNKFFMTFGNIGLEGYARLSTNEISSLTSSTDVEDPILDRIVQFTVPYSMGSSYRVGGTAFVTFRPSGFFNLRLYTNVYDYGYSFTHPETNLQLNNHKVSWSARLNCWVKLYNKYQVFASANYSSPTISLASERKARYFLNCGVRADFFKRKLSAYINVQDIFNWGKTIGTGSSNTNPYLLSESNSYTLNSRYISAGITLRFGKMELENRSKEGSEDGSTSTTTE